MVDVTPRKRRGRLTEYPIGFDCFINGHSEDLSKSRFNHINNLRLVSECGALQTLTQTKSVAKNLMG
jgi:hypothetical protein